MKTLTTLIGTAVLAASISTAAMASDQDAQKFIKATIIYTGDHHLEKIDYNVNVDADTKISGHSTYGNFTLNRILWPKNTSDPVVFNVVIHTKGGIEKCSVNVLPPAISGVVPQAISGVVPHAISGVAPTKVGDFQITKESHSKNGCEGLNLHISEL